MSLPQISSFAYIIAPQTDPKIYFRDLEKAPWDLVIAGNSILSRIQVHSSDFPLKDKLIIGYVDIGASTSLVTKGYLNIKRIEDLPIWFGKSEPGYDKSNPLNNLYTIEFWRSEWLEVIKRQIDDHVKYGYDGIFLDEISSDEFWYIGNRLGNTPNPNAEREMYELLGDISLYVSSLRSSGVLNRPFYLIANNPERLIQDFPDVTKYYDIAFRESIFWVQEWSDGAKSVRNDNAASSLPFFDSVYKNQQILINDYPPLDSPTEIIPILQSYVDRGWTSSLQRARQSYEIMYSGPFVHQASKNGQLLKGANAGTNYLLGGDYEDVTMTGAISSNNYFLLGDANQRAVGGSVSDSFYMHPLSRYNFGEMVIKFASTIKQGMSQPNVSIEINGNVVVPPTPITAQNGVNTQDFRIDISNITSLNSVKILVSGTSYKDPLTFSNVSIKSFTVNGVKADLSYAVYTNGGFANGNPYSNNGYVLLGSKEISQGLKQPVAVQQKALGGDGVDIALYQASSKDFSMSVLSADVVNVKSSRFLISDVLNQVERVQFLDKVFAMDLLGNAGNAARTLAAVFGKDALNNTTYAGIAISLFDQGMTKDQVSQVAIDAVFGVNPKSTDVVKLLWRNLFNADIDASNLAYYSGLIDSKTMTAAQLTTVAADLELTGQLIDLVGLSKTGWEYLPYGG